MSTSVPPSKLYLARARACVDAEECVRLYDEWAPTFNAEVTDKAQDYVAPDLVAQMVIRSTGKATDAVILDAGCGTGLVGQALAQVGMKIVDGLDISPAMLDIADKTGVYRHLNVADLTKAIEKPSEAYDIVTCVGTFTAGHVGPDPALREFIRVLKRNGIIIATVLEQIWVSGGFQAEVKRLEDANLITVVSDNLIDYVKGHGDKAVLLVLRKKDAARAQ